MSEEYYMTEKLSHHGIKGMKWGVTRTRAQLDADSEDVSRTRAQLDADSEDVSKAKATKEKIHANRGSTDPISNKDLQHLVTRMNLEKNYRSLAVQTKTNGQKFVDDLFKTPIPTIAMIAAQFKYGNSKDKRIKAGLQIADTIVKSKSQQKKKK